MKKLLLFVFLVFAFSVNAMAQQQQQQPTPTPTATPAPVIEANPADVASIDAIIKATYDVISGDAGVKRDWARFRSLFHRTGRLMPSGKNPNTGVYGAGVLTPDDYIQRNGPFLEKDGFHEREIGRRTEIYGNIAHVFSSYESFRNKSDKTPFMRGINSFQLINDGKRWYVVSIFWQQETTDNPIPKKYLKMEKD